MPTNIEFKARIDSVDALLPAALALGDDDQAQLIRQDDTFFETPHGRLKLRVFADGSGELIHYVRADDSGPKRSDWIAAPVAEPDELREVLGRALGVRGRVRKERLLVLVGPTRIHLDRVEGLGEFVEVEVVMPGGADGPGAEVDARRVATGLLVRLGVVPERLVREAYIDLLRARGDGEHATR